MKRCTIGLFSKIITFLVFMIFFVPLTGLCFYIAFLYPQASSEEKLTFLIGFVMFGGLLVFAGYRIFYLGLVWVEYDREKVIFHYSRKEEYKFQWEEMPGNRVQIERAGGGYVFCIQENRPLRKIPLNHFSRGYKDFEKVLKETGVLDRAAIITSEKMKQNAEQTWEQYKRYRETYPHSVQPKPEGDCIVCPDCQGKGLHLKKLPLLKVDVGKVCKTCGGSGYVPK
jgi:hypothetical protein